VDGAERDPEKERQRINDYQNLVAQVNKHIKSKDFDRDTLALISKLLARNPEFYTVWNYRRLVVGSLLTQSAPSEIIPNELKFLVPLLMQFPKCYWIWNYRMWLLGQVERYLDSEDTLRIWNEELSLVGKMLSRDERNFHGWDYRRHVVSQIERLQGPANSLVESELAYTTSMVRRALQNFSALHYRSRLIPRLLTERDASQEDRRRFFESELDFIQDVLIDPFNSAAWFYHDVLMQTLLPGCPASLRIIQDPTAADLTRYYSQELSRISEMLEDFDDCKFIYQALIEYSLELTRLTRGDEDSTLAASLTQLQNWGQMLAKLDPLRLGRWKPDRKQQD
jgi:geranylgeranyl transferase type-2 subunit alpha